MVAAPMAASTEIPTPKSSLEIRERAEEERQAYLWFLESLDRVNAWLADRPRRG